MKTTALRFVVGLAAVFGFAAVVLCVFALLGPNGPAGLDLFSAWSVLLLALGIQAARMRRLRRIGHLVSALAGLGGILGIASNSMGPSTAAALICFALAALLLLIRHYGAGQAMAALASLPSLGSGIGTLLGTDPMFERLPALEAVALALCAGAMLGGTAHRGSIRIILSKTISGRFARRQIVVATLAPIALAALFTSLLPPGAAPNAMAETVASITVLAWITIGATALVGRRLDIKRHRAEADLRSLARHDALTGLLNRRSMNSALPQRHARARELGRAISLLMCDLDHFKRLNDEYGHAVGDEVLKRTASRVSAAVRDTDLVFRYGGEEIAVLLDCGAFDAQRIADKIRESVKAPTRRAGDPELPIVTISIGAATSTGGVTDIRQLMASADECLYSAKDAGRDCVRHVTFP
jgi:diguanylate cyclase (GGDEF)-like protein